MSPLPPRVRDHLARQAREERRAWLRAAIVVLLILIIAHFTGDVP